MRYYFKKSNILRSQILIEKVFAEGRTLKAYPLKLVWLPVTGDGPATQVLFAISKKNIRRAVNRNLIRRRMREVWRKELPLLEAVLASRGLRLSIALVYSHKEPVDYSEIEKKIKQLIQKLVADITQANEAPIGQQTDNG